MDCISIIISLEGKDVCLLVNICICMNVTEAGQQVSLPMPKASRCTIVLRHKLACDCISALDLQFLVPPGSRGQTHTQLSCKWDPFICVTPSPQHLLFHCSCYRDLTVHLRLSLNVKSPFLSLSRAGITDGYHHGKSYFMLFCNVT